MKSGIIPIGLKRPDKGRHSEKNTTHKNAWFEFFNRETGRTEKRTMPFLPPCIPAGWSSEDK